MDAAAAAAGGSAAASQQLLPGREAPKRSAAADQLEIGAEAGDEFLFSDDAFPSLADFPCLSSPSTSTFSSSSSSSSSSCPFSRAVAAAAAPAAGAGDVADGFEAAGDIDLLDFSFSLPWDAEPPFPDASMIIEDAFSAEPPQPPFDGGGGSGPLSCGDEVKAGAASEICMAGDDLPRFFMEWLTSNKDSISAEDLRSIRLRRSTIEAAAARLGGGQQGTMQLLKLILTWVQNHHLHRKRRRAAAAAAPAAAAAARGPSPLPSFALPNGGVASPNPSLEFGAGCDQDNGGSWVPYPPDGAAYPAFASPPPPYSGDAVYPVGGPVAVVAPYAFHQSCSTSSVVVNSQSFSPEAADMHAVNGASMSWPQQYPAFPVAAAPYAVPFAPPPYAGGFAGQYPGGHPLCPQRAAGMAPSATKEARKKRMARQRRLSCLHQHRNKLSHAQSVTHPAADASPQTVLPSPAMPPIAGCSWGLWPQMAPQPSQHQPIALGESTPPEQAKSISARAKQQMPMPPPPPPPPPATNPSPSAPQSPPPESSQRNSAGSASEKRQGSKGDNNLRFLLQKVLKQSDVGSLGRIVLPKKEAEIHLPELDTRDGISIPMEDIGTSRVWNMRYRFWPNNKSRMYLLENTGDFVRSNELQEGDFIVIYSDVKSGKYMIRGVKVRTTPEQSKTASSSGGKQPHHKRSNSETSDTDASTITAGGSGSGSRKGKAGKSPHGVRRARERAAMRQMAVSI